MNLFHRRALRLGLIVIIALSVAVSLRFGSRHNSSPAAAINASAVVPPLGKPSTQPRVNRPAFPQQPSPLELPHDALEAWQQPSKFEPVAAFQAWATAYPKLPSDTKAAALPEGVRLATERRSVMSQLIRLDPEQALASAVPESIRRSLPAEIMAQLENRVDGIGELEVTGKAPGNEPLTGPGITRAAVVNGQRYAAFVYGRRDAQPSRWNVPIHGLTLDGALAVSELPGRVLEPVEVVAVKPAGADPVCSVSQLPTTRLGTETVVQIGNDFQFFCGRAHASSRLVTAAETETLLPPGFGFAKAAPVNAASGGIGVTVPTVLPDGDAAWTRGNKRIVMVRVNFDGANYHDLETADCAEIVARMDEKWDRWSYGRCRLLPVGGGSYVTPILNLPEQQYNEDDISDIWSDAEDFADDHGHPPESYDYLMVLAGDAYIIQSGEGDDYGPQVTWGGLGRIGGPYTFLRAAGKNAEERIARNASVGLHELGHNLGLLHASSLFTTPKVLAQVANVTFYQTGEEYGDPMDRMGTGGDDYNVHYKNWLHWLGDGQVPVAVSDGRYTLHEHDLGEDGGGLRGLQVPFSPGLLFFDSLFVEYRLFNTAAPYLTWGPTIRLGYASGPKSFLLDGTPETANDRSTKDDIGTWDSQLLPGRTFSFTRYGLPVHITTLSADPDSGVVEVQINHGTPPGNQPPSGTILPWSGGAVGQTVYFTADASDPEVDDLSYYWEISGSTEPFPPDPTIGYVWKTTGVKTVKCIVSDMHGGVTTLTYDINIVDNKPPTITLAASAATDEDHPITIDFSVSDPTTDPSAITTTVISSNKIVLPAANVSITSLGGGNRRLSITPAPNQHGLVPILVTASDGLLKTTRRLDLTIRPVTPGVTLIPAGAAWRYYDAAKEPPAGWKDPGFQDTAWQQDTARFVFNQGFLVPRGWTALANAPGRITTYFRRTFEVGSPVTGSLTLRLLCDDSAVVYLNGTEVWRQNLPEGPITPRTLALRSIEGAEETTFNLISLNATDLTAPGLNTLAVEVHDRGGVSRGGSDVSFDAELALLDAPTISRIPNLTTPEDTVLGPIAFSASDSESPGGSLEITGTSSNPDVISDSGITTAFSFNVRSRVFSILPRTNASGRATITLRVSDGSSVSFRSFSVTVTPVNDAPTIDKPPHMAAAVGELPKPVLVHVHDVDNDPATLTVTATSSNPAVVQSGNIQILPGPAPDQRWLLLNPTPGVAAQATITISASDGSLTGKTTFVFRANEKILSSDVDVPLLESGANWQYWTQPLPADTLGQPIAWNNPGIREARWPQGPSPLGYGGNGEKTTLSATPYRVTTYFRTSFNVPDPASLSSLKLRLLRDDGAAVYLNGALVYQSNLPRGVPQSNTLATVDISGLAEQTWLETTLGVKDIHAGRNLIAVEVHQSAMPNLRVPGDLGFDLELIGLPAPAATEDVLIPQGDLWSYWDSNQYPGDAWRDGSFQAEGWPVGLGRFGLGIAGETTVLDDGMPNYRHPSVLFRRVFAVSDPAFYSALHLMLQRDDGAVVYLNGVRVLNDNMAPGATSTNWALSEIPAPDQTQWRHFLLSPSALVRGLNLLAVELHQFAAKGTDLNFDAQLSATVGATLPPLFIRSINQGYELSWPSAFENWTLRSSQNLPGGWSPVGLPLLSVDGWVYVNYPAPTNEPVRLFQITKP